MLSFLAAWLGGYVHTKLDSVVISFGDTPGNKKSWVVLGGVELGATSSTPPTSATITTGKSQKPNLDLSSLGSYPISQIATIAKDCFKYYENILGFTTAAAATAAAVITHNKITSALPEKIAVTVIDASAAKDRQNPDDCRMCLSSGINMVIALLSLFIHLYSDIFASMCRMWVSDIAGY
mgnify:CR=1 FL=1